MQSPLPLDVVGGQFRGVGGSLIHHHHQMTTRMRAEELLQELDHFRGGDPLVVEPKHEPALGVDGGHDGDRAALAGNFCLGVWPRGAQVLPSRAVREMLASSSQDNSARYSRIAERILGSVPWSHCWRAMGSAS